MVSPSTPASNAIVFTTYSLFLVMGCAFAYKFRHDLKGGFLSGNRTQTAFPVALNFIASGLGSSVLFAWPELATITGVQGVIVYAASASLPLLMFAWLGSIIRRKTPEGFVLTEWTRQRYGTAAMLYLSFATLVTLFLYLTAELSAVGQVVAALTSVKPLPVMIVQVVVTAIYTSLGGFRISFVTDTVQASMVIVLIVIAAITIGVLTKVDTSLIESSGFLKPTLLGWQLMYILPVCILTNNFFLSSYWLRAFASKTDRDLWLGVGMATGVVLVILTMVGCTGLIAVWSGALALEDVADQGSIAFFLLLDRLPAWVIGLVLVMVVTLSCASFDTLQTAMISSASNDLFRNKLNIWYIRLGVVVVCAPAIAIALGAPSILQIYLISDLVSACIVPVLCIGLMDTFYWWRGFEVIAGGLGGIISAFIFGIIFYEGDVQRAGNLLLVSEGLYANDWSVFGLFVAAPVGSILWAFAALAFRLSFQYIQAKRNGRRFDAFDRPQGPGFGWSDGSTPAAPGGYGQGISGSGPEDEADQVDVKPAGKFF